MEMGEDHLTCLKITSKVTFVHLFLSSSSALDSVHSILSTWFLLFFLLFFLVFFTCDLSYNLTSKILDLQVDRSEQVKWITMIHSPSLLSFALLLFCSLLQQFFLFSLCASLITPVSPLLCYSTLSLSFSFSCSCLQVYVFSLFPFPYSQCLLTLRDCNIGT